MANFDLGDWYLSIPTDKDRNGKADNIWEKELSKGYKNSSYFYTGSDGGLVFKAPLGGTTTSKNTKNTRTELREMLRRGNTKYSTQGVNKNNWVLGSASSSTRQKAGGVNGELTGTLAVNHVPTSGDKEQRGKVIVSQIHATNDEPFRLYYRKLPNHSKGVLYFAHEPRRGSEKWFAMIGRDSGDGSYLHRKDYREPKDGITLNEKFSYKVKVVNDTLTVTIMRPGKRDVVQKVDMKGSGFNSSDQYMYFKVGAYNHNNTGKSKDYSKVTYYAFDNKHTGYSQPNKTPALSSSSYLINCGGKDFYDDKGKYFMADKYFRGGNTYSTATGIDGTINDTLYQTERYGRNLSYAFPVKNGEYSVKLLFSEIYFSQNNKRVFDVELENRIIYDDFDIHRQAGADTAIYSSFNTNVNDGVLNLDFNASIDNAKISAIEIIPR